MEWTFYHAQHYRTDGKINRKAECVTYFRRKFHKGLFVVEKGLMVGSVYYAAVRSLKGFKNGILVDLPKSEQRVFATILQTKTSPKNYKNFGYRVLYDFMCPKACDCPIDILNRLTPTDNPFANKWRNACRKKTEAKTVSDSLDSLPYGTIIMCGDNTVLEKNVPRDQSNRALWLVLDLGEPKYYTKKQIQYKGYKVLSKKEETL